MRSSSLTTGARWGQEWSTERITDTVPVSASLETGSRDFGPSVIAISDSAVIFSSAEYARWSKWEGLTIVNWRQIESVLSAFYELTNPEDVCEYLLEFPDLLGALLDLSCNISKYFNSVSIVLRTFMDPEDDSRGLTVTVITGHDVPEALRIYDDFTRDYWINQPYSVRRHIGVTLEFMA